MNVKVIHSRPGLVHFSCCSGTVHGMDVRGTPSGHTSFCEGWVICGVGATTLGCEFLKSFSFHSVAAVIHTSIHQLSGTENFLLIQS